MENGGADGVEDGSVEVVPELTRADFGMRDLPMVAGVPEWIVRRKGICVCGHRVMAHRGDRGTCWGVPLGRRTHNREEAVRCLCVRMLPVVLVSDTRAFRATWKSADPLHPFRHALSKLRPDQVEQWLVEYPMRCETCERVGGVDVVFYPGTHRMQSAMLCVECEEIAKAGSVPS